LGEYNVFNQEESNYVLNVFTVDSEFVSSPLLILSILKFLIDKAGQEGISGSYVTLNQLLTYFDAMGIEEEAARRSVQLMLNHRLIDPYDASADTLDSELRVAVSHCGRMHYEMATTDPIYVAQMALTTPMRDNNSVERMRKLTSQRLDSQGWKELRRTFLIYCMTQDRTFVRIPKDPMYAGQLQLRKDLEGKWVVHRGAPDESLVDETPPEMIMPGATGKTNISGEVIFYNAPKGFGFLKADGDLGDVFLQRSVLEEAGFANDLETGAVVIGDIGPGEKGRFMFTRVHRIEKAANANPANFFEDGTVEFYNGARGFGFANVPALNADVYISGKVMHLAGIINLVSGDRVKVRISRHLGRDNKLSAAEIKLAH
jgi:cold shock CspA family protein